MRKLGFPPFYGANSKSSRFRQFSIQTRSRSRSGSIKRSIAANSHRAFRSQLSRHSARSRCVWVAIWPAQKSLPAARRHARSLIEKSSSVSRAKVGVSTLLGLGGKFEKIGSDRGRANRTWRDRGQASRTCSGRGANRCSLIAKSISADSTRQLAGRENQGIPRVSRAGSGPMWPLAIHRPVAAWSRS